MTLRLRGDSHGRASAPDCSMSRTDGPSPEGGTDQHSAARHTHTHVKNGGLCAAHGVLHSCTVCVALVFFVFFMDSGSAGDPPRNNLST